MDTNFNNAITRRYLSSLEIEYEESLNLSGKHKNPVCLLHTLVSDEKIEHDTFEKIASFWKELEKKKMVKVLSLQEHAKMAGMEFGDLLQQYKLLDPYQNEYYETETKLQILNGKKLKKLRREFDNTSNKTADVFADLDKLLKKRVISLIDDEFYYNGEKLLYRKQAQNRSIFSSILLHNAQGESIVTYEAIYKDVPTLLSNEARNKNPKQQKTIRNNGIRDVVNRKINDEIIKVIIKSDKAKDLHTPVKVKFEIKDGEGVFVDNPLI